MGRSTARGQSCMPESPPASPLVADLPMPQEGGRVRYLAAAPAHAGVFPLLLATAWCGGGVGRPRVPRVRPTPLASPSALRRSACGPPGPVAFAHAHDLFCAMHLQPRDKIAGSKDGCFALSCGCGAKYIFDPKGDFNFREGCDQCRYDRAELLSIANGTFDDWRESSEVLLGVATLSDDGTDREVLLRRRERARAVRERQEARLIEHISDQIVEKYIDVKNQPRFLKATRCSSTQTTPVVKHQVSQTVAPPLPNQSWERAPPNARFGEDCPVAAVADQAWEDVDQTGNTRSFWFHPDRRLELAKSPQPPLLRGDPRRQRTRYETDVSREELKSYSVKAPTTGRFGQYAENWFRNGSPALYAARSGYWRPGCLVPDSDGTSIRWGQQRDRSPVAKVNFHFSRCGTTRLVKFERCTVWTAAQCDEPHGEDR
jgi:hypothetical protein